MTKSAEYAEILEEQGAEGFTKFIIENDELDLPPQMAALRETMVELSEVAGAENDQNIQLFLQNASQAINHALTAEEMEAAGPGLQFDFMDFLDNPMEAIKNLFSQIQEAISSGNLSSLFRQSADPEAIEQYQEAALDAAQQAAAVLRGSDAPEAGTVDTDLVANAVREIDTFAPGS